MTAAQGFDVEGAAEDLALYTGAGQYSGLENHPELDKIATFYMKLDETAFMQGLQRGALIMKGLQTQKKEDVCNAAKASRPKIETHMTEQARFLAKRGVP